MRRAAWLAVWPAGVTAGVVSVRLARSAPDYALANTAGRLVLEVLAGGLLGACGLMVWRRQPGSRIGVLLAAAACGWFLAEWNTPGAGSPVVFTLGLVCGVAAPPLIAHCLLDAPSVRLERAAVATTYGASLLALGLLPALIPRYRAVTTVRTTCC